MQKYIRQDHISFKGLIILGIGSILLGAIVGGIAYLISQFVYLLIVFPLMVGILAIVGYQKVILYSKIHHVLITSFFGLVTGLMIAFVFYQIPFIETKNHVVNEFQEKYQITKDQAENEFNTILYQRTGSHGLIGYLKIIAEEGVEYENSLIINSIVINSSKFTLKSTTLWTSWILETLLFSLPLLWFGYIHHKKPFSLHAMDWYNDYKFILGTLNLAEKNKCLIYFKSGDWQGVKLLLNSEEKNDHPRLEICKQEVAKNNDIFLVSIFETWRKNQNTVKRKAIESWEINRDEFTALQNTLIPNLETNLD